MYLIRFFLNKIAFQYISWPGTFGLLCKTQKRRITEDLGEINSLNRNEDLLPKHFLLRLFLLLLGFGQVLLNLFNV